MSEGVDTVDESQDDATHADRDSQQPQTVGQVKNRVMYPDPHEFVLILIDWIRTRMGADLDPGGQK